MMIIIFYIFLFFFYLVKYFGLNLGAVGFAFSSVIGQFLSINVLLYFNFKYLGLSFKNIFYHQIYSILIFFVLARFSYKLLNTLVVFEHIFINNVFVLLISGIVYLFLVVCVLLFYPKIIGVKRGEIKRVIRDISIKFKKN